MGIGSITSIGKQNVANTGGLKYKKIQKDNKSFCFIGDDTVVDHRSLINFIIGHGGSTETVEDNVYTKRTAIPAGRGYVGGSYPTSYTSLIVRQTKQPDTGEWSTPTNIYAVGYHSTSGNPFDSTTIDDTWTVV